MPKTTRQKLDAEIGIRDYYWRGTRLRIISGYGWFGFSIESDYPPLIGIRFAYWAFIVGPA